MAVSDCGDATSSSGQTYFVNHPVAAQHAVVGLRRLLPVSDAVAVPLLFLRVILPCRREVARRRRRRGYDAVVRRTLRATLLHTSVGVNIPAVRRPSITGGQKRTRMSIAEMHSPCTRQATNASGPKPANRNGVCRDHTAENLPAGSSSRDSPIYVPISTIYHHELSHGWGELARQAAQQCLSCRLSQLSHSSAKIRRWT